MNNESTITRIFNFINSEGFKYVAVGAIIAYVAIMTYMLISIPNPSMNHTYLYSISITIPLLLAFLYASQADLSSKSGLYLVGIVLLFGLFMYFITSSTLNYLLFNGYVSTLIFIVIVILGLSILLNVFGNNIRKLEGWTGFIVNLIFYIPCMLTDLFEFLIDDYNQTSNIVFALFILEIVFILIYMYLPAWIQSKIKSDGAVLLETPVYLNRKTTIIVPSKAISNIVKNNYAKSMTNFKVRYAISAWIYVNGTMPSADVETPIFDYSPHIKITYKNDAQVDTMGSNRYNIYLLNNTTPAYSIQLSPQKWNYVVFNVDHTNVDLFINGNLERSYAVPSVSSSETPPTLNIGHDWNQSETGKYYDSDRGMYGSICNVVLYSEPLESSNIVNQYNLLKIHNPPLK